MNPQEQRIAIAEVVGWKKVYKGPEPDNRWIRPDGLHYATTAEIPDYLNDLNAIREAVLTLKGEQKQLFAWTLVQLKDNWKVWKPEEYFTLSCWEMGLSDVWDCLSATPAQWSEAFLRTIGKWRES